MCSVCYKPGHKKKDCPAKSDDTFMCPIPGCRGSHHPHWRIFSARCADIAPRIGDLYGLYLWHKEQGACVDIPSIEYRVMCNVCHKPGHKKKDCPSKSDKTFMCPVPGCMGSHHPRNCRILRARRVGLESPRRAETHAEQDTTLDAPEATHDVTRATRIPESELAMASANRNFRDMLRTRREKAAYQGSTEDTTDQTPAADVTGGGWGDASGSAAAFTGNGWGESSGGGWRDTTGPAADVTSGGWGDASGSAADVTSGGWGDASGSAADVTGGGWAASSSGGWGDGTASAAEATGGGWDASRSGDQEAGTAPWEDSGADQMRMRVRLSGRSIIIFNSQEVANISDGG